MAYVLIEYNGDPETASIVPDGATGFNKLFASVEEAFDWAKVNCGFDWVITYLEKKPAQV